MAAFERAAVGRGAEVAGAVPGRGEGVAFRAEAWGGRRCEHGLGWVGACGCGCVCVVGGDRGGEGRVAAVGGGAAVLPRVLVVVVVVMLV